MLSDTEDDFPESDESGTQPSNTQHQQNTYRSSPPQTHRQRDARLEERRRRLDHRSRGHNHSSRHYSSSNESSSTSNNQSNRPSGSSAEPNQTRQELLLVNHVTINIHDVLIQQSTFNQHSTINIQQSTFTFIRRADCTYHPY